MYNVNTECLKQLSYTESLCVSLAGILPQYEERRIDIFPVQLDPGLCICITRCRPGWEFVPGCEAALNALLLVVRTGLKKLRKKAAKTINLVYRRAKAMVFFSAPRFLRL